MILKQTNAEFGRELIRERTIEGLRRVNMQGKKVGRPREKTNKSERNRVIFCVKPIDDKNSC
jgi:DNA invertase Pin-like site-specific DNA recombinase